MQMPTPDAGIIARKARVVARLRAALPRDAVIDDAHETRAYAVSYTHLTLPTKA